MQDPNTAVQPAAAPAVAPSQAPDSSPAAAQVAPDSSWSKLTSLRIDDETDYPTPDKAIASFQDARRQIKDYKGLQDRFTGYVIK